jgi:hypothetical protein
MDNHTYGEVFEREAPRLSRPSRSTTQFRTSYNEDLMSLMSMHLSVLVDSVGPPSVEVCRAAASFP